MSTVTPTPQCSVYSRLTPFQARGVLLCALAFFLCGIWQSPAPQKLYQTDEQAVSDDLQLYLAEIDRMRAGENYYPVAAEELVARGFPTRSVFNWRTPASLWLMAALPSTAWRRGLVIVSAIVLILMSIIAASRDEPRFKRFALPVGLLLTAPLLGCFSGDQFVLPELAAGLAIGLSVAAYGVGRSFAGIALGLLALFLRELSLPYCAVCLLLAVRQRCVVEIKAWVVGLICWAIYYAFHCWSVAQWIGSDAVAHQQGWIRFGGLTFVLGTVQVNYFLLTAPLPLTVIYLSLAVLGLAGWSSLWGQRVSLTCLLYFAAFCIVGQDFNRYWGFLTAPLLCLGVARSPVSLIELLTAARLLPTLSSIKSTGWTENRTTATA